jgi:hypothetical protein
MPGQKKPAKYKPATRVEPARDPRNPNLEATGKSVVLPGCIIEADGPCYGIVVHVHEGCIIHRLVGAGPDFMQGGVGRAQCDYAKDVRVTVAADQLGLPPDPLANLDPVCVQLLRFGVRLAECEASVHSAIGQRGAGKKDPLVRVQDLLLQAIDGVWAAARLEFDAVAIKGDLARAIK